MIENSKGYKTFLVFDYFMVALLALICLLPMIHILVNFPNGQEIASLRFKMQKRKRRIWETAPARSR